MGEPDRELEHEPAVAKKAKSICDSINKNAGNRSEDMIPTIFLLYFDQISCMNSILRDIPT